jgi:hypothetical protein
MKRWQSLLIGLVFSILFLIIVFLQADLAAMVEALRSARYGYVILGALLVIVNMALRALRWSILTQGRLGIVDSFWLFSIGFLFNNVLPARLGEVARAYLAGRRKDLHFTSALSSIVVERLFDLISVAVLIGLVLLGLPLPAWATTAGAAIGGGSLLGVGLLALAARYPDRALAVGERMLALVPRIGQERAHTFLSPFVEGLGGVSDLRVFSAGLAVSIFSWVVSGFSGWVLMLAFWDHVPFLMGQLVVAAAGLGVAVPAAPSGVGPFEAAVIGVLTASGYNADISRTFALITHGVNVVMTSLLGGIGLLVEGMSFGQVAREARAVQSSITSNQLESD